MTDEPEEENEIVDSYARLELEKLRDRFEGASLVPKFSVLLRKMFNSIIDWGGWEVVGMGLGILILCGLFLALVMFGAECNANYSQEHFERQTANEIKQFKPVCEALGLEYLSIQKVRLVNNDNEDSPEIVESVTCVGVDRIVTVNARDITQTKVHLIKE